MASKRDASIQHRIPQTPPHFAAILVLSPRCSLLADAQFIVSVCAINYGDGLILVGRRNETKWQFISVNKLPAFSIYREHRANKSFSENGKFYFCGDTSVLYLKGFIFVMA